MKKIIPLCLLAIFVSTSSFAKDFDPDEYLNTEYKQSDESFSKMQKMVENSIKVQQNAEKRLQEHKNQNK